MNTKYDQRAEQRAADHTKNADADIQSTCVSADVAAMRKCVEEKVDAKYETRRAEYDLSAQEKMADWALGVLAVSAVTLIITAVGVWFVRQTLVEARKTTDHALIFEADKISIKARFTFHNIGKSPATHVSVAVADLFPDIVEAGYKAEELTNK